MGSNRDTRKSPPAAQSEQDQQFEERLRIAEHIMRALREAGYPCDWDEDDPGPALKSPN